MDWTTAIAVYGALVSSVLAGISIFDFIKKQQLLLVRYTPSFSLDACKYEFIVSNISSQELVITDCFIGSLSYVKGEGDVLE